MNACERAIDQATTSIAAQLEPIDARLWRRLLIYVPNCLVLERDKHFKNKAATG